MDLQGEIEKTYEGGCHCGGVRFKVDVKEFRAEDCNCSICSKKGFLHLIIPEKQFTLLQGKELLETYTFNTGVAQHKFCRKCGIHAFYTPRSHPNSVDVNIRCLDGNVLSHFKIISFDGQNWEQNVEKLRSEVKE